ncbi:MAG: hypothetical protein K2W94_09110 [Alphaproteobacteria bacterium]|nr:hypothetical protein [Alphaproteobacteria bacterium]
MLTKNVRNFLIGIVFIIPMLLVHPVCNAGELPADMKLSNTADDLDCWRVYRAFLGRNVENLRLIFTFEGKGSTPARSELCYQRLFGFKVGHTEFDTAVRERRREFRETLLVLASTGNEIAKSYAIEAVQKKYLGFQDSEITPADREHIMAFMPRADSDKTPAELVLEGESGDEAVKNRVINILVQKNALPQIKDVALRWAETSDRARTIVLEGIFETKYGLRTPENQGQALALLEKYALTGNGKAFEIMRTKIGIPPIKDIAKKPAVIAATDAHHINGAVGGWRAFLTSHGVS